MKALPRVTALMSAFNEADIIGSVVEALTQQGIHVHLIDDGSTDGTAAEARSRAGSSQLTVEQRQPSGRFEWEAILRRKEDLAEAIDADWFIHHDADEFRESPWPELTLREAIGRVDEAGYTAIDFEALHFLAADDAFRPGTDPRGTLTTCRRSDEWDRRQIKCWKKGSGPQCRVDLAGSGGHDVQFEGRRVFPVKFLLRHYPIRGLSHGRRKVMTERLPRYLAEERARGWHVQYDAFPGVPDRPTSASQFDAIASRLSLLSSDAASGSSDAEGCRQTVEQSLAEHVRQLRSRAAEQASQIRTLEAERRRDSDARSTAQRAADDLRAIRGSWSWRVTAPLRALGRPLKIGARTPAEAPSIERRRAQSVTLGRLTPVSDQWGCDRGKPIDRIYIERFLSAHRMDITGRVLEVKDNGYTRQFGSHVADSHVLDIDPSNTAATIVDDLARLRHATEPFDCFILTQTLHIIYDIQGAVRGAARLLKPGGVLLCTLPAVSRVNDENGGLASGDYWRMTRAAALRLFGEGDLWKDVTVETFGNVSVCAAFLYGLAAEEMAPKAFEHDDPWFPLIHAVWARRQD